MQVTPGDVEKGIKSPAVWDKYKQIMNKAEDREVYERCCCKSKTSVMWHLVSVHLTRIAFIPFPGQHRALESHFTHHNYSTVCCLGPNWDN